MKLLDSIQNRMINFFFKKKKKKKKKNLKAGSNYLNLPMAKVNFNGHEWFHLLL